MTEIVWPEFVLEYGSEVDKKWLWNEHGTIYAISSDFSDRMTTQHLD